MVSYSGQLDQHDVALEYIGKIIERIGPTDNLVLARVLQDRGDALWHLRRFKESEASFLQSLEIIQELDQNQLEVQRLRARAYEQLGNLNRIEGNFLKSIEMVGAALSILDHMKIKPTSFDWQYGWLYLQRGNSVIGQAMQDGKDPGEGLGSLHESARRFLSRIDVWGLAAVADRVLWLSVLRDNAEDQRLAYKFAMALRRPTGGYAPPVDREEFLNACHLEVRSRFGDDEVRYDDLPEFGVQLFEVFITFVAKMADGYQMRTNKGTLDA